MTVQIVYFGEDEGAFGVDAHCPEPATRIRRPWCWPSTVVWVETWSSDGNHAPCILAIARQPRVAGATPVEAESYARESSPSLAALPPSTCAASTRATRLAGASS